MNKLKRHNQAKNHPIAKILFSLLDMSIICLLNFGLPLFSYFLFWKCMSEIKDSYSFETRMCGTVKCRPTLAYRVHFDSINISDCTTTPTRNWPNAVLMLDQCLRRWPTLNQHLVSVPCWLGKLLLSICCFQTPW